MPTLTSTSGIVTGVSAAEIVAIAQANVGQGWTADGCVMLTYAISNLAGLPFFNLANYTIGGNPLSVQNVGLSVPHSPGEYSGVNNIGGDGWSNIGGDIPSVATLRANLQPGDIVRVYHSGNPNEHSYQGNWSGDGSQYGAHSFIVESVSGSTIMVIDNWGGNVSRHNFNEVVAYYARNGQFQSAFISRIDSSWSVPNTLPGQSRLS